MVWIAAVALLAAVTGCTQALAIHFVTQPDSGVLTPRDEECDAPIVRPVDDVSRFREVGDVSLGDTGLTFNCGRARVLDELRRQACRFGADAAQIVREHPAGSCGCYRVRARLLVNADTPRHGEAR
jgi:hypothetical protein